MKMNTPVTQVEQTMQEGQILVSVTDTKGSITFCNEDFIRISGFKKNELLGKNHNIVRHPDMPPEAFADLWATNKAGRPWTGIVKNRCKNGDYYWVQANITPITENGQVSGYMSVRTKPSTAQIQQAERLYQDIRSGRANLQPGGLAKFKNSLANVKLATKIYAALILLMVSEVFVELIMSTEFHPEMIATSVGIGLVLAIIFGKMLNGLITHPLQDVQRTLHAMSEGDYFNWIQTGRHDEIGKLQDDIKSTQIKLGFDIVNARAEAKQALRIQSALNHVNTNVMIADADNHIIYTNQSLISMFRDAQNDIRNDLPNFNVDQLCGTNIDSFHKNPHHQRNMLANLHTTHQATLNVGGRSFDFIANPVLDEHQNKIGTVVEWSDQTQQLTVEKEISDLIIHASQGDLSQRLPLDNKNEFFKKLAIQLNGLMDVNELILGDTTRILGSLAQGNLTQKIETDYEGIYAQLKNNINNTIDKLTEIIGGILQSANDVQSSSNDIAQGNGNLSARTQSQASSLENTAASMEEMTGTIRHNAENTHQANQLAANTLSQAEQGGEAAKKAVCAMNEINASSRKIADITSVIDEIAFQTNLLALNASVEAAHAGDQGRGFAVVANEVRDLAQRSAEAAKEIKILIEDSLKKVDGGSSLVEASGKTLGEIIESTKKVNNVIGEISAAGSEQATGIEQVNKAILQIDETTQQNSALVEQTARASESLSEQSQRLSELVSFFTLKNQPQPQVHRHATPATRPAIERRASSRPWSQPSTPGTAQATTHAASPAKAVGADDWDEF